MSNSRIHPDNQRRIIDFYESTAGMMTQSEIAKHVGMSNAAVSTVLTAYINKRCGKLGILNYDVKRKRGRQFKEK